MSLLETHIGFVLRNLHHLKIVMKGVDFRLSELHFISDSINAAIGDHQSFMLGSFTGVSIKKRSMQWILITCLNLYFAFINDSVKPYGGSPIQLPVLDWIAWSPYS